jgi:hypothetical protein
MTAELDHLLIEGNCGNMSIEPTRTYFCFPFLLFCGQGGDVTVSEKDGEMILE